MSYCLINNALMINEGKKITGSVLIKNQLIEEIYTHSLENISKNWHVIDAKGKLLIPGVIDDQVHFRDPGMLHKGDLSSESRAAVAGGITSFMDMPNVKPQTTTQKLLEERFRLGAEKSLANYSFYMGATNDNLDELLKTDPKSVCGIKIFMGASTGNMLVDDTKVLSKIFEKSPLLIATHCEDSPTIQKNQEEYQRKYGDDIPVEFHGKIRSARACYLSSSKAVKLARKFNTRLHLLHLSTGVEMNLLEQSTSVKNKKITAEVCVHHLLFNDSDYPKKKARIRWNPAIKTKEDQEQLWEALLNDKLDVIATDHAPHTEEEKDGKYLNSASGGPLVQHSLVAMLEQVRRKKISLEKLVEKMCHAPANLFQIKNRGFIRKGYYADLVLLKEQEWTASKENTLYKCGWTPFNGEKFHYMVEKTFVNGHLVYDNGKFNDEVKGMSLYFDR